MHTGGCPGEQEPGAEFASAYRRPDCFGPPSRKPLRRSVAGACFLYVVGIGLMGESHMRVAAGQMLIVGIVILALIGFLFWVAFRRRRPPPGTDMLPR